MTAQTHLKGSPRNVVRWLSDGTGKMWWRAFINADPVVPFRGGIPLGKWRLAPSAQVPYDMAQDERTWTQCAATIGHAGAQRPTSQTVGQVSGSTMNTDSGP